MICSADILTNFEHCQRWGHWSRSWQRRKMSSMEMFAAAASYALPWQGDDPGEDAASHFMELAHDRGLEVPRNVNTYRCAINHAAAVDLVVTAIRETSPAWLELASLPGWTTSAQVNVEGTRLRRFLPVAYWNDEREFFFKNNWHCIGEIAQYRLPMELVVAVIGPMTGGRRHAAWSKALFNPRAGGPRLRFRLRQRSRVEGFAESWRPIYREDHDEIDRKKWLEAMFADEVLQENLFVVRVPVPEETQLAHIRDLAARQLARLGAILELPPKQLTTCTNPIRPCPFQSCCWSQPESRPEDGGFDQAAP